MFDSFGPYREKMLRMRSWSLNVDWLQCPGIMFVCFVRWHSTDGALRVTTPFLAFNSWGLWYALMLLSWKNGWFFGVVFVSERDMKSILFSFMYDIIVLAFWGVSPAPLMFKWASLYGKGRGCCLLDCI